MYYDNDVMQCIICGHTQFAGREKCLLCGGELHPADEETTDTLRNKHRKMCEESAKRALNKVLEDDNNIKYREENSNIPKCPTCGSTNIKKLSDIKKATHALTFGLFSATARSQFECLNCHYKW